MIFRMQGQINKKIFNACLSGFIFRSSFILLELEKVWLSIFVKYKILNRDIISKQLQIHFLKKTFKIETSNFVGLFLYRDFEKKLVPFYLIMNKVSVDLLGQNCPYNLNEKFQRKSYIHAYKI